MLMLITYDVNTQDAEGRRRLRRVANSCLDYGQRVQNSVFECDVDPARWALLKAKLIGTIDAGKDSLRFYHLGANGKRRIEHVGAKVVLDLSGPLLF